MNFGSLPSVVVVCSLQDVHRDAVLQVVDVPAPIFVFLVIDGVDSREDALDGQLEVDMLASVEAIYLLKSSSERNVDANGNAKICWRSFVSLGSGRETECELQQSVRIAVLMNRQVH